MWKRAEGPEDTGSAVGLRLGRLQGDLRAGRSRDKGSSGRAASRGEEARIRFESFGCEAGNERGEDGRVGRQVDVRRRRRCEACRGRRRASEEKEEEEKGRQRFRQQGDVVTERGHTEESSAQARQALTSRVVLSLESS